MKVFSFAGWSKSGKTTLIVNIIKKLKQKNKRVIALKNIHNKYNLEPESKDSFLFLEAGSDEVFLVAKHQMMSIKKIKDESDVFDMLKSKACNVDIVLLEGFYGENIPCIEVFDFTKKRSTKFPIKKLSAIISDQQITRDIPCFNSGDIDGIIKFIEDANESNNYFKN